MEFCYAISYVCVCVCIVFFFVPLFSLNTTTYHVCICVYVCRFINSYFVIFFSIIGMWNKRRPNAIWPNIAMAMIIQAHFTLWYRIFYGLLVGHDSELKFSNRYRLLIAKLHESVFFLMSTVVQACNGETFLIKKK